MQYSWHAAAALLLYYAASQRSPYLAGKLLWSILKRHTRQQEATIILAGETQQAACPLLLQGESLT